MEFLGTETNFYRDSLGRAMTDRDANECHVMFGTCPIDNGDPYNVSKLVRRSWNGKNGGRFIEESSMLDTSITPTLQVEQKYQLTVLWARHYARTGVWMTYESTRNKTS